MYQYLATCCFDLNCISPNVENQPPVSLNLISFGDKSFVDEYECLNINAEILLKSIKNNFCPGTGTSYAEKGHQVK